MLLTIYVLFSWLALITPPKNGWPWWPVQARILWSAPRMTAGVAVRRTGARSSALAGTGSSEDHD